MRQIKENKKEYFSVQELADVLGVSRVSVFKKIQNKQIKASKVGRNYIIHKRDLDGVVTGDLTDNLKTEIEKGIEKTIHDYGDVLRKLGKE